MDRAGAVLFQLLDGGDETTRSYRYRGHPWGIEQLGQGGSRCGHGPIMAAGAGRQQRGRIVSMRIFMLGRRKARGAFLRFDKESSMGTPTQSIPATCTTAGVPSHLFCGARSYPVKPPPPA